MMKKNNDKQIEYKIVRKKRKTISIKIDESGEIIVISPFYVSEETISYIVSSKKEWILSKMNTIKKSNKKIKDGEKFLYLGRSLSLNLCDLKNNKVVEVCDNKLNIFNVYDKLLSKDNIKKFIKSFYMNEAKVILKERTDIYSNIIGKTPNRITIKDQKTLWGSCSSKGNINYNYRIIMAPVEIVDYIVVHELCHLVHMNHSRDYWQAVERVLPDYKQRRKWLKENGLSLRI